METNQNALYACEEDMNSKTESELGFPQELDPGWEREGSVWTGGDVDGGSVFKYIYIAFLNWEKAVLELYQKEKKAKQVTF